MQDADAPTITDRRGQAAAAEFNRPLLLTARQDLVGLLRRTIGKAFLTAVTFSSVAGVLLILVFIVREAWPFFAARGAAELFSSTDWYPTADPPIFGALANLVGSLYVTIAAALLAVPVGVLAAVMLSDILPFALRQVIKPIIEILAAIPSVAFGFFAIMVLAPWLTDNLGLSTGANALNASVILAFMAMPTIVSISEDALSAVGRDLREGAYALGSTRAEVIVKVVVPAAHGGIVAAIILGVMRAVGETMVVWMASGNASQIPHPWWDLTQSIRTLTATVAGEMGETERGGIHYHALFALGLVLLAITLALNLSSEYFLRKAKIKSLGAGRGRTL